jgi:putative FmdB family regulatory protein
VQRSRPGWRCFGVPNWRYRPSGDSAAHASYPVRVPRYEFRCRDCADLGESPVFEVSRPMSAANDPATCPSGHVNTVKLLSAVALAGAAGPTRAAPGGGCCGGGCGCG